MVFNVHFYWVWINPDNYCSQKNILHRLLPTRDYARPYAYTIKKPAKRFKINLVFKWLIYSMFICTIAFIMLKHYPNGATLWFWMLRFMLVVFATAIILQSIYAKRTWCSAACPVGAIMSWELKAIRHISKAVKKRT